ncbi:MAG: hypothetical protein ABSH08_03295 [Tepidisphaeraceae bacterium]
MKHIILMSGIVFVILGFTLRGAVAQTDRPPVVPPREIPAVHPNVEFAAALDQSPAIKKHLVWTTGNGKRQTFEQWTPAMKQRIETFYRDFQDGKRQLDMRLPGEEMIDPNSGKAFFTSEQAFDIYAAHAAHVVFVEAQHLVPWSIEKLPGVELDELLGSSAYFARIGPSQDNTYPAGIKANRDFAEAPENDGLGELNSDPRIGFDFLSGKTSASHKSLIADTELKTLENLTWWLRNNVVHGPIDDKRHEREKANRWLDKRLSAFPGTHAALAAEGCHSSSKLMVDLARSVNIPLLHVRAIDPGGDSPSNFFNRTHGGLIYGWGGREVRIVWHTDEINAMPGSQCYPIDPKTGTLAPPEEAQRMYFDALWVSPAELKRAGFEYKLERVFPNKGFGHDSRGVYEDRLDYGMMIGIWNKKGTSDLSQIDQLTHDYELGGESLLSLWCHHSLEAQLASNIKVWQGDFTAAEVPELRPLKDYNDRAAACVQDLGGADKVDKLLKQWSADRGKNLLVK